MIDSSELVIRKNHRLFKLRVIQRTMKICLKAQYEQAFNIFQIRFPRFQYSQVASNHIVHNVSISRRSMPLIATRERRKHRGQLLPLKCLKLPLQAERMSQSIFYVSTSLSWNAKQRSGIHISPASSDFHSVWLRWTYVPYCSCSSFVHFHYYGLASIPPRIGDHQRYPIFRATQEFVLPILPTFLTW